MALAPVALEDHSRKLKRLKDPAPGEPDTPETRRAALESHRAWLEQAFGAEAGKRGLVLDPAAPLRLELRLGAVGEIRPSVALWGFASSVAVGVLPGIILHNEKLVLGLLAFELAEEGLFWFGGSALFGAFFAPVVMDARMVDTATGKKIWDETYYVLSGRTWLQEWPESERKKRESLVRASLRQALHKLTRDLAVIPGFPKALEGAGRPAPALH